jgi:hypothetical protein
MDNFYAAELDDVQSGDVLQMEVGGPAVHMPVGKALCRMANLFDLQPPTSKAYWKAQEVATYLTFALNKQAGLFSISLPTSPGHPS